MFSDQNVLVVTICILVGLLIWGRWRYDAVTLVALAALVLFDVIQLIALFQDLVILQLLLWLWCY